MTERTLPSNARMIPEQATCVFRGEIFDVYQWQQELFDGTYATYEMLKRPDSVVIIAVDEGKIVTQDEEQPGGVVRYGTLPMGRVDASDASVVDAAKRELREETGLEFANWKLLEVRQPEPKIEWFVHIFVAWEKVAENEPAQDAGEKIIVGRSDYDAVRAHYAATIAALRDIDKIEDLLR